VGTSILGAIAGQMLIPIPFFGALIGTVIGGYLGDKGTKKITSVIENKRFG
jgi:phage tail tape-measure protein